MVPGGRRRIEYGGELIGGRRRVQPAELRRGPSNEGEWTNKDRGVLCVTWEKERRNEGKGRDTSPFSRHQVVNFLGGGFWWVYVGGHELKGLRGPASANSASPN